MNTQTNLLVGLHHLKISKEHFEDFIRSHPGTVGEKLFKNYVNKIDWIYTNFLTHPNMGGLSKEIKAEWESDVLSIPAIIDKLSNLTEKQREMVEYVIDTLLTGEEITIKDI